MRAAARRSTASTSCPQARASAVRSLAPGGGARLEVGVGLALCRIARGRTEETLTPEQAEDLLLVDGFLRRPPPELSVLPLDADRIEAELMGRRFSRAA